MGLTAVNSSMTHNYLLSAGLAVMYRPHDNKAMSEKNPTSIEKVGIQMYWLPVLF